MSEGSAASRLAWLSSLPAQWDVSRFRWLLQSIEQGWSPEAENRPPSAGEWGVLRLGAVKDGKFDETEAKALPEGLSPLKGLEVKAGDFLITRANTPSLVGSACFVQKSRPGLMLCDLIYRLNLIRNRIDGKFLSFYLSTGPGRSQVQADARGTSGSMVKISQEHILEWLIPLPPLLQQQSIADYLDRETTRLDALVAAKERLLALLAEKRRALVTRAVTRGLDPNVPMRDSGVPWLGKVPAHWEVCALRFLVSFSGGGTPDTSRPELWDGQIPWVSPKDMKKPEIADAEDHVSPAALETSPLKMIEPGAVLIVVRGMILAHSFPAALAVRPVTINQDMKALRCDERILPSFLRDYFRGHETQIVSLADSSAHGTRKLETESLGRFEVLVPPLEEQQELVSHLAKATERLDSLRAATEHSLSLLKERRAALISAAVTGRMVVPGGRG